MMTSVFPEEFRPAGRYVIRNGKPEYKPLDSELLNLAGVVYARMCDGKIVYIGSTDRLLSKRIGEHLRIIASKRGTRYREWAEGRKITIIAYRPKPVHILGHEIQVHRGVEAALIRAFGRPGELDW